MRPLRWLICGGFSIVVANTAVAYEIQTHRDLTEAATSQSILAGGFLERELGIDLSRRLVDLMVTGAAEEDNVPRFIHHFHDPVMNRPLTHACAVLLGTPVLSATWAADQSTLNPDERFAWPDARNAFLRSLTSELPGDRDAGLAKTFETLGHIVHLIQDAAQPQHTRNEIHAGIPLCGAKSIIEEFVKSANLARRTDYTTAPKIPVFERLSDYWLTMPPTEGRGMAQYSNRNFVTPKTNFNAEVQGNHHANYLKPSLDLAKKTLVPIRSLLGARTPEGVTGDVTFFGNTVDDRVTGTSDENERMTTLSVFDDDLRHIGQPLRFSHNRFNVLEAAKLLLPRAVGYSAGLVDFFFRGTLRAGIDESGAEPVAIVQNASKEAMADGSLTIYADLPTGQRVPVSGPVSVTTLAPGEEFADPIVLGPHASNATRFVAVYRGGLGQETRSGDSPGAVIGKVFNAERVEEIFAGAERWQIRTPRGVFVLPLRVAEWPTVKWGDSENMILAVAPLRANTAMPLVAYRLQRVPNSGDIVTDGPGGMVVLTEVARASFPLSEPLTLATVNFNQVVKYRQTAGRYNAHSTRTWIPKDDPNQVFAGHYEATSQSVSGLTFEAIHQADIPFTSSFALNLDDAHNANVGIVRDPYSWRFVEFFLTAEGKILATVVVTPGVPPGDAVTVPLYLLTSETEKTPWPSQTRTVRPFFPAQMTQLLWALVDLTNSTVVASTAEAVIDLSSTDLFEAPPYDNVFSLACTNCPPPLYRRMTHTWAGGPDDGTIVSWEVAGLNRRTTATEGLPQVTTETGQRAFGGSDLFRRDLRGALAGEQFADFSDDVTGEQRAVWYFDCNGISCSTEDDYVAFEAIRKIYDTPRPPAQLRTVRRSAPTSKGERLVVLAGSPRPGLRLLGKLAVWDHEAEAARIAVTIPLGFHSLPFVTAERAVVWNDAALGGTSGSYVVDLNTPSGNGSKTAFFPDSDLRFGFALLEPDHLYNTSDLRFYRGTPPLTATRLPALLVPVPGNPTGSYHIFKLQ